jgi:hypothetical protein
MSVWYEENIPLQRSEHDAIPAQLQKQINGYITPYRKQLDAIPAKTQKHF